MEQALKACRKDHEKCRAEYIKVNASRTKCINAYNDLLARTTALEKTVNEMTMHMDVMILREHTVSAFNDAKRKRTLKQANAAKPALSPIKKKRATKKKVTINSIPQVKRIARRTKKK